MTRAGADDCYAIGPPDVVHPAVMRFERDLSERCELRLQWGKTEWFTWDGELPPGAPPSFQLACMEVDGQFERGFMCYRSPLGSDMFVR